jgi:hypothetical protein
MSLAMSFSASSPTVRANANLRKFIAIDLQPIGSKIEA